MNTFTLAELIEALYNLPWEGAVFFSAISFSLSLASF